MLTPTAPGGPRDDRQPAPAATARRAARLGRHAGRGVPVLPRAAARSAGPLAGGVPRPGRVGCAVPRAEGALRGRTGAAAGEHVPATGPWLQLGGGARPR